MQMILVEALGDLAIPYRGAPDPPAFAREKIAGDRRSRSSSSEEKCMASNSERSRRPQYTFFVLRKGRW